MALVRPYLQPLKKQTRSFTSTSQSPVPQTEKAKQRKIVSDPLPTTIPQPRNVFGPLQTPVPDTKETTAKTPHKEVKRKSTVSDPLRQGRQKEMALVTPTYNHKTNEKCLRYPTDSGTTNRGGKRKTGTNDSPPTTMKQPKTLFGTPQNPVPHTEEKKTMS